jgi:spoIIIJ-associated protein
MIKSVEISAKTVRDAVAIALEKLKTSEENVNICILTEGSKGLFGLIGNKSALVKVTIKETKHEKAKKFLSDIFEKMAVDVEIQSFETEDCITLKVKSDKIGIIIGRRGETLDSLQFLTSLVINRDKETYKKVSIDVENYRQKREETLERLAFKLAERVVQYKKNITLEPMNPYERRIIHAYLHTNNNVETYSVGEEPNRKVVITLSNKKIAN